MAISFRQGTNRHAGRRKNRTTASTPEPYRRSCTTPLFPRKRTHWLFYGCETAIARLIETRPVANRTLATERGMRILIRFFAFALKTAKRLALHLIMKQTVSCLLRPDAINTNIVQQGQGKRMIDRPNGHQGKTEHPGEGQADENTRSMKILVSISWPPRSREPIASI